MLAESAEVLPVERVASTIISSIWATFPDRHACRVPASARVSDRFPVSAIFARPRWRTWQSKWRNCRPAKWEANWRPHTGRNPSIAGREAERMLADTPAIEIRIGSSRTQMNSPNAALKDLSPAQLSLLSQRLKSAAGVGRDQQIRPRANEGELPLSFAQQRCGS